MRTKLVWSIISTTTRNTRASGRRSPHQSAKILIGSDPDPLVDAR